MAASSANTSGNWSDANIVALLDEANMADSADDNSVSDSQKNLDNLNSTAKGKDFDKAYIDHEVDYHKAVLDVATKAMSQAQNTELKNLTQKAAPAIEAHLDLAESIQKKLK